MTRKHFELIAKAIADVRDIESRRGHDASPGYVLDHVARELADVLATTNTSFDRQRFLLAAGFQSG